MKTYESGVDFQNLQHCCYKKTCEDEDFSDLTLLREDFSEIQSHTVIISGRNNKPENVKSVEKRD